MKLLAIFGAQNNGYHKFQLQIDIENLFVLPSALSRVDLPLHRVSSAGFLGSSLSFYLERDDKSCNYREKYAHEILARAAINCWTINKIMECLCL